MTGLPGTWEILEVTGPRVLLYLRACVFIHSANVSLCLLWGQAHVRCWLYKITPKQEWLLSSWALLKLDIKQMNKHKLQIERLSPFSCSPETITTLLVGDTPIQNKKLK